MTHINKDFLSRVYEAFQRKIEKEDLQIAYEVYGLNRILLSYMDPQLSLDKVNWISRKRNSVLSFGISTLALAERNNYNQDKFLEKYGYRNEEVTLTPGAVPIISQDGYMIGVLTVTGLTPQQDHDLATHVLSEI